MILNTRFVNAFKTTALIVAGSAMLAACGGDAKPTAGQADGRTAFEKADDMALGDINAPITVVEYASVTCGHCANWDATVWPDFRKTYVDTGKVRYVFRPFPTAPVELANAGHLLAACAADDKYFDLIHAQMRRQRDILSSSDIRGEYVALAKSAGMNESEFEACMSDEEKIARLDRVVQEGFDMGVTGTPSFFVNGTKAKVYDMESFAEYFAEITDGEVGSKPEASEEPSDKDAGH